MVTSGVCAAAVAAIAFSGSPATAGSVTDVVAEPTVTGNTVSVAITNNTLSNKLCGFELVLDPGQPADDGLLGLHSVPPFTIGVGETSRDVAVPDGNYHLFWLCLGYASPEDETESLGWTIWGSEPPLPVATSELPVKEQLPSDPIPVVVASTEPDPTCISSVCLT